MRSLSALAFAALLACIPLPHATARAQDNERPAPHQTPRDVANRSLRGPRAETISGVLLTASAPLVGLSIAFLAGPGIFECGLFGEPDPACEQRREEKRDRAGRLAFGIAIPWGLAGVALMAHGGHRIRQIRVARRSLQFEPTFTLQSVGLRASF